MLLLRDGGLVKSQRFGDFRYIGDPINAVKIFNELRADELVFLDIMATATNQTISVRFVRSVGEEANMPFAAGGGSGRFNTSVTSSERARRRLSLAPTLPRTPSLWRTRPRTSARLQSSSASTSNGRDGPAKRVYGP